MNPLIHHRIDYIEFKVHDIELAKSFYSQVFGWVFNDYGPEYCGIKDGDGEIGGFALDKEIKNGGPLVVLYSNHLEKTYEIITNSQGTIAKEIFDFPGGRRFHFNDPSGNELAVWSDK